MFDSVPLLFYTYSSSVFSYDLPPFLATLVFVFLLADASPFLLDFFLVAIYLDLFYVHTIINDLLLFPFKCVCLNIISVDKLILFLGSHTSYYFSAGLVIALRIHMCSLIKKHHPYNS